MCRVRPLGACSYVLRKGELHCSYFLQSQKITKPYFIVRLTCFVRSYPEFLSDLQKNKTLGQVARRSDRTVQYWNTGNRDAAP